MLGSQAQITRYHRNMLIVLCGNKICKLRMGNRKHNNAGKEMEIEIQAIFSLDPALSLGAQCNALVTWSAAL